MSSYSIDTNNSPVEVDVSDIVVVAPSVSETITKTPLVVTAHPRNYSIVGDDIFTIKRNNAPDPWFISMIYGIVDGSPLSDEVSDLIGEFNNFEDGITKEIGEISDNQDKIVYDLSVIKTSTETNTAGISTLDIVKVTSDEATAISNSTIAAWQNGGEGGAWFDSQVAVVSNIAYSAAKSASTLTASISSQQDQLIAIIGDLDSLEQQIDGVVETLFFENTLGNVGPNLVGTGNIDVNSEPYVTWKANNTLSQKTGDTYVLYETDISGNRLFIGSWRFGISVVDEPITDSDGYLWLAISDSKADEAYQLALDAQLTADSKITTFYQSFPPTYATPEDQVNGVGDIWVDSDDRNKMYRYNGTSWITVRDTDITASVDRLDQATVDVDGTATAISSLTVNADGNISGYRATATNDPNDPGSEFRIFADRFVLAATAGQSAGHPFTVDAVNNQINFNGTVEFANISNTDDVVLKPNLQTDIDSNVTIIDGGKINTGILNAKLVNVINLNADNITSGNIYNTNGSINSYTMRISLDDGFIHIK